MRLRSLAAASLSALALANPAHARPPRATTLPAWIIESTQLAKLPASSQTTITSEGAIIFGQNAEHYTSVAPCPSQNAYAIGCLSLETDPPPAGSWALYDPEEWTLTPSSEFRHPCRSMRKAAQIMRAHKARVMLAPPFLTRPWDVKCAAFDAGPGGIVHVQSQPHESDLPAFSAEIKRVAAWAHAAAPGVAVSFGVSTRPAYDPTVAVLVAAYKAAKGILGAHAPCWLNIVPLHWAEAHMAARFLASVAKGGPT